MVWLRAGLGILSGALAAALGALLLGEYEFTGALPLVAGPLFGLAVGEIVVGVGRRRSGGVAAAAAAVSFVGVAWAGWIDSSEGVAPVKTLAWVAAGLAAAVSATRVRPPRRRSVTTSRR